ncbi:hypothetical protein SAMN04490355_10562 [Pelosinus propionicus DSM 13327]|uniref:DUF5050 domain-containing protein n=1 Tax=Pelosinus propionicus DSM 13327 TaxID=1123291 RepID=A0A1I4P117_9FIRM|nr:hypothetical protein SAMN04490355_10562 [Pelosinus propionicus DSM 13327]
MLYICIGYYYIIKKEVSIIVKIYFFSLLILNLAFGFFYTQPASAEPLSYTHLDAERWVPPQKKISPIFSFNSQVIKGDGLWYLESLAYNTDASEIIAAFKCHDTAKEHYGRIVVYDGVTHKIKRQYSHEEIWHANDMTYNNSNKTIVLVPMKDIRAANYLYIFDASTMKKLEEVRVEGIDSITGVAYNQSTGGYVVNSNKDKTFYITDDNFNVQSQFKYHEDATMQSIEIYNDMIYYYCNNIIKTFTMDGKVDGRYQLTSHGESEGITSLGDGKFLIGFIRKGNTGKYYTLSNLIPNYQISH